MRQDTAVLDALASDFAHGMLSTGWADDRLGAIYSLIEKVGGDMPPGSTELGCLAAALKQVELADVYVEKRQKEAAE